MSWSSHDVGKGCLVTANMTGLLSFMLGATDTNIFPDVAPAEIVMTIDVFVHELIVMGEPFSVTKLPFGVAPNPVPVITT